MLQNTNFESKRKRTPSLTWQPWLETNSLSTAAASNSPVHPHLQQHLTELMISTHDFLARSLSLSSSSSTSCLSFEHSPFQNSVQSEPTDLSMSSCKSKSSPIQQPLISFQVPTPDIILKQLQNNQSIIGNKYSAWMHYFTAMASPEAIHPSAVSTPHRRPSNDESTIGISKSASTVTLTAPFQTPPRYQNRLFCGSRVEEGTNLKSTCRDPEEVFTCQFCGKVYDQQSAFKMHVRTHTLPCQCQHCGKSFSRKWLLKGHERTHTGERPYRCNICSRSFADRSNLRAHMQTHQINKKYRCPGCPRSFSRMGLLHKHLTQSPTCHVASRNRQL